jgi:hypothetical protein
MFEHLKRLDPLERTAILPMPELNPGAALVIKYAGEGNAPYWNALLARAAKRVRNKTGAPLIDAATLEENRSEDRAIFPGNVLVSWAGVQDTKRVDIAPTQANMREFCQKLPAWLFDRIRDAAANPATFMVPEDPSPVDAAELAGN